MSEPIISPWIFYLAYLAKMSFVLLMPVILILGSLVVVYIDTANELETQQHSVEELEEEVQKYNGLLKILPGDEEYVSQAQLCRFNLDNAIDKLEEAMDNFERMKVMARQGLILAAALLGLWVVIPSEATIYRMVVAQHVTPHNLQVTGETIEAVIDKPVDKIIKAKEGK